MDIPFTKMHGLGNDFMVIDNRSQSYEISPSICFARYVVDRGMTTETVIPVNTLGGLLSLKLLTNGEVKVAMGVPNFVPDEIPLRADGEHSRYQLNLAETVASASNDVGASTYEQIQQVAFGAVAIGNPHAILHVVDVDSAPVATLGPILESHAAFPARVNVGFMQVLTDEHIRLRVFERGVGETQACGTGACAAVASGVSQGLLKRQVKVTLTGGDLTIVWPENNKSIEMTGPCSTVFEGQTRTTGSVLRSRVFNDKP